MARRKTPADKLESVLTHYSVSEAARRLGVSRRTVQRWNAGEHSPSKNSASKISRVETGVRASDSRTAKREGFKKPSIPVDLPAHRQTIPDPKQTTKGVDPRDARRIYSNTVIYDLRKASDASVLELIQAYQKVNPTTGVRFIYRHRKSPEKIKAKSNIDFYIPAAVREKLERGIKNVNISTSYEAAGSRQFRSPEGILDAITDVRKLGRLLYVVIQDRRLPSPGHGRKKPRRSR